MTRLAEIGELLEIQDRGACPCGHSRTLVERRIAEIDVEIKRLSGLRPLSAFSAGGQHPGLMHRPAQT